MLVVRKNGILLGLRAGDALWRSVLGTLFCVCGRYWRSLRHVYDTRGDVRQVASAIFSLQYPHAARVLLAGAGSLVLNVIEEQRNLLLVLVRHQVFTCLEMAWRSSCCAAGNQKSPLPGRHLAVPTGSRS